LAADRADAAIMAELAGGPFRATLTPITLATIGLGWDEVQRIARELRTVSGEHITVGVADSPNGTLEVITRGGDVDYVDRCAHGIVCGMDEIRPAECDDCNEQHGSDLAEASIGHYSQGTGR
jgi:hypothetical protein